MAHMVFKKPLQSQSARENYIKQRQGLRRAKELGYIDVQAYEDAKKNLLSETPSMDDISKSPSMSSITGVDSRISGSTSSSASTRSSIQPPGTPPPERRKGSILDRNNVARLVYKSDVQTEDEREAKKAERKARKARDQAERFARLKSQHEYSVYSLSPFDQIAVAPYSMPLPTRTPTTQSSTSDPSASVPSVKSSSLRINFNIFRKRTSSTGRQTPPLLDSPPIPITPQEMPAEPQRRPGSADTSSTTKSSITRRNTESHGRRGGGGGAILDAMPMTFADIFLFGPAPGAKSRASSRRHSFSSQHTRPSIPSPRLSAEGVDLVVRKAREEFVFQSRPTSLEVSRLRPHSSRESIRPRDQPPLSTVLQDIFLSLLNDFSDTSVLFSYPKHGRIRRNSYSSSFRSITRSVRIDEEDEIGKAIGGEESFLIDESTAILKVILEKRTWFLMAMKWLSFGRVLFSPGHHIIELSSTVEISGKRPEASILDLDGSATADWSWHLADEYPFAEVFNVLLPQSPRPPRNSAYPQNLQFITATTLSNLSALPTNSIDVVTSHNLPRLLFHDKNQSPEELQDRLTAILRECARVLKPSGYFEITVVDPVMNNMGPRTRNWIMKHVAPLHNIKPSKMILAALEQLSGQGEEVLFNEVKECWVWMPTTSIGDELSTVTSMVGRHLYDELFAPDGEDNEEQKVEVAYGVSGKKECRIWKDEKVIEECQKENTAFRWLKCYARKI